LNETLIRWKARIGSLKLVAAVTIGILLIATVVAVHQLAMALSNPEHPQPVTVQEVVSGAVGDDRFVTLQGYAKLDHGYQAATRGKIRSYYYYLLNDESRSLVVVKADPETFQRLVSANVSVSGMTRAAPGALQKLIQQDIPGIRDAGYLTTPTIFLEENAQPPEKFWMFAVVVVLLLSMGVLALAFLFPSTVFQPMPVDTFRIPDSRQGVSHTIWGRGTFYKLSSVQPFVELAGQAHRFRDTPVNIKPLPGHQILIQPLGAEPGQRTYSMDVGNQSLNLSVEGSPDQWAIVVDEQNFIEIDPGKLYGWNDRWAIRMQYSSPDSKRESIILAFDNAVAQAECVDRLRELGFMVGMWIT